MASGAAGGPEAVPGYTDLRRIGSGGFSTVYQARQEGLDRTVALKVLAVEFVDTQVRRRFLREVRLASQLTGHPHVVSVIEAGQTGAGRPFIAMEFYSRGSLADRLAAEGPLPAAEVAAIGVKIATALTSAHELGIVHQDVKPQNILISRYGEPALADFGTARLTAGFEQTVSTTEFTLHHAAPEVLRGEPGSPQSDVYSLGSTLYHLLSGRPPFADQGDGVAGMLLRAVSEPVPAIRRTDVPEELVAVVLTAMAKDPAVRYPTAAHLGLALEAVMGQPTAGPTGALPVPPQGPPQALVPAPPPPPPSGSGSGPGPGPMDADTHRREAPSLGGVSPLPGTLPPIASAPSQVPVTQAGGGGGSPNRRPMFIAIGVAAVAAICAPLLFAHPASKKTAGNAPNPAPSVSQTSMTSAAGQTPTAATSSPLDDAQARPTAVKAQDRGAGTLLTWQLPGPLHFALVVEAIPVGGPGTFVARLSAGATTTLLTSLNPSTGYCFLVGSLVTAGSVTPRVVWSAPTADACIRGAVPQGG